MQPVALVSVFLPLLLHPFSPADRQQTDLQTCDMEGSWFSGQIFCSEEQWDRQEYHLKQILELIWTLCLQQVKLQQMKQQSKVVTQQVQLS